MFVPKTNYWHRNQTNVSLMVLKQKRKISELHTILNRMSTFKRLNYTLNCIRHNILRGSWRKLLIPVSILIISESCSHFYYLFISKFHSNFPIVFSFLKPSLSDKTPAPKQANPSSHFTSSSPYIKHGQYFSPFHFLSFFGIVMELY